MSDDTFTLMGDARHISPEWLRIARQSRGLSGADVADQIGVTVEVIGQWENGQAHPSAVQLRRVRLLLHYPLRFFYQTSPQEFTEGSLVWHIGKNICDPCEREDNEFVDAEKACVLCGEDVCDFHARAWPVREPLTQRIIHTATYCPSCYERLLTTLVIADRDRDSRHEAPPRRRKQTRRRSQPS
jgi:transcriptional regulator with XRE-family HTH domain